MKEVEEKDAKQTTDFIVGEKRRQKAVAAINCILNPKGMNLTRIHTYLKKFSLEELQQKNILLHRLREAGMEDAVGLDYILEAEWTSRTKICCVRFPTWDIYYKLPSDMKEVWESFTKNTIRNFLFLCVNDENVSHYWLNWGKDFTWRRSSKKGNKNRVYAVKRNGTALTPKQFGFTPVYGLTHSLFEKFGLGLAESLKIILKEVQMLPNTKLEFRNS